MGLLSEILLLPLAPVRGVTWVAEQVRDEATRQEDAPQELHAALAELDRQREAGELSADEADAREEALLQRLLGEPGPPGGPSRG